MVVPKFEVRLGLGGLDVWMEFEDQSYGYHTFRASLSLTAAGDSPQQMHHSAYHMQKVKEKLGTSRDSEVIFLVSKNVYQIKLVSFFFFLESFPIISNPS